jgi:4-diphosphocytidyl-2-C-methyl-D-erythritol kinase
VTVSIRCPAKVNLHLEVLGRRADGYHELLTVFAAIGLWDELEFEPADELTLSVEPANAAPPGGDNLVLKAAAALSRRFGSAGGAHITLRKRIPAAAGLGGGSSDAAAALAGLDRFWRCGAGDAVLHELAAGLGADVAFFLVGGVALGRGRGELLTPLPDLPPWWLVVLPGGEAVSTAAVYRLLSAGAVDSVERSALYQWSVAGGDLPVAHCRNDLQPTVVRHWPGVGRRLARIEATAPMLALVTGSGGAVFGVYESEAGARVAAAELAGLGPLVLPLLTRAASRIQPSAGE